MFALIEMTDERDDGADFSVLRGRWTGEDGHEGVAGEIAGTANAVHDAAAKNVCAIHVAGDVNFDGGVNGNNTETADEFGAVGNFLRAQEEPGTEFVEVAIDVAEERGGDGQGTTASETAFFLFDEFDDGVLNDFRVHFEARNVGMLPHGVEHGIGGVADAGLNWQERLRNQPATHFTAEEVGDVFANFARDGRNFTEGPGFVGSVVFDDRKNLFWIHFDGGRADPVGRPENRDGIPERRVFWFVNIVEAAE